VPPLRAPLGAPRRPAALATAAAVALALALLAAAPARAAGRRAGRAEARGRAAPAAVRRDPDAATVVYVTRTRAYLDAGAADGVAVGAELRLARGGRRTAGTCVVESVAARRAVCRSETARVGDTVALDRPRAPPAPKPLPPLVPADELARRARLVAAAPVPRVEAKPARAGAAAGAARPATLALSHVSWTSDGRPGWQQERADVLVRGLEVRPGIRLHADLRALRWTSRPGAARARPADATQLLVWQAELAAREPGRPFAVALGRLQPWGIPGATVLDGVQAGLRRAGRGELGVFGGAVPEPGTLEPTLERSTAGLYGSVDAGGRAASLRQDLRAAVVTSPETGSRFEGELRSSVLLARRVSLSGDLRVGLGGRNGAPGGLDGGRVELSGRPVAPLLLSGSFRYWGLRLPEGPAAGLFPWPERRADASAGWDLGPLVISAGGGFAQDLATGLERRFAGPEVSLPRLFGARGGVSAGYLEERGWAEGRSAFAQAVLSPLARLRLTARLYWAAEARPFAPLEHEAGVFLATSARLARRLSLRASVLARAGGWGFASGSPSRGLDATLGIASGF
jgi:hypothetical protein